jgi:MFS transporter, DHA1 family, multidrug resistance protein
MINTRTLSQSKIVLLLSYITIASISAAIITPALPLIEHSYKLGHGALEWVISIYLVGYMLGQLIYGPLANKFGRLWALRCGLLLNLVGILLCLGSIYSLNYSLLLTGRLITALGAASGLTCTFMLLNELLTKEQAMRAMSFTIVAFTLGIGAVVVVGGMIAQYLFWGDCFWLLLIHGLVMLALTWQLPETLTKSVRISVKSIVHNYLNAIKSTQLVAASLVVALTSVVSYTYSAAAPLYAHMQLHLTPGSYGIWNIINMVGMLASGFISRYLMPRYTVKSILKFGMLMIIPCIVSLLLLFYSTPEHPYWFFITTALLYLFSGCIYPSASYLASNAISDKASAASMMSFINMGSATTAVVLLGYLPLSSLMGLIVTMATFFVLASAMAIRFIYRS